MTFILSGFADEISQDLGEQLAVLAAEGITHLELRSVWSANVADLDDAGVARFRRELDGAGVRVSAIGSPVGKIAVDAPLGPELERLRRVADIAESLGTAIVRVFSFFIPTGEPPERYRQQVIDRMRALAAIAEQRGLVLAHENEKEIYGDLPERCAGLIEAVSSPGPEGNLRRGELRAVRGPPARRGLPAAPSLPGLPADEGRAGGDRRGRAGRAGRRAGP